MEMLGCYVDELRRERRVHHGQMTYRCAFQSCPSPLRHLLALSYKRRVFRFINSFRRRNLPKTLFRGGREMHVEKGVPALIFCFEPEIAQTSSSHWSVAAG